MSILQAIYDSACSGQWADPDASQCPCRGHGWFLSDVDTWHKCPCHYVAGQPHPEDDFGDDDTGSSPVTASEPQQAALAVVTDDDCIPF